jgi:archaemetzincin
MTAPETPEWSAVFREKPQSLAAYVASCANRRSDARAVFSLLPLGRAGARTDLLEPMRRWAEAFFGLPARLEPARPMIEEGWSPQRRSHNASILLDRLAPARPDDALVLFALVEEDLFARSLPFVFGEGNFETGCAVGSLARFGPASSGAALRRALRLLAHEGCHALSIAHCPAPGCLMRGANSLEEFDRQNLEPCANDLEKLRWNTGLDPERRAGRIRAVLQESRLEAGPAENRVLPPTRGA